MSTVLSRAISLITNTTTSFRVAYKVSASFDTFNWLPTPKYFKSPLAYLKSTNHTNSMLSYPYLALPLEFWRLWCSASHLWHPESHPSIGPLKFFRLAEIWNLAWSAIFLENRKYESLSQFRLGSFQRIRPALTNKRNIRSNIKINILGYVENAHPSTPSTLFSIPTLQYIDRSPGSARSPASFLPPERAIPDVLGQKSGREEVRSSRRRLASPGKCCNSQKQRKRVHVFNGLVHGD